MINKFFIKVDKAVFPLKSDTLKLKNRSFTILFRENYFRLKTIISSLTFRTALWAGEQKITFYGKVFAKVGLWLWHIWHNGHIQYYEYDSDSDPLNSNFYSAVNCTCSKDENNEKEVWNGLYKSWQKSLECTFNFCVIHKFCKNLQWSELGSTDKL